MDLDSISDVEEQDKLLRNIEAESPERLPFRKVIEVLVDIPYETLERASPQSKLLKTYIKVPMVLSALTSALFGSLYVVTIKLVGEMLANGQLKEDWPIMVGVFLVASVFGIMQVYKFTQC